MPDSPTGFDFSTSDMLECQIPEYCDFAHLELQMRLDKPRPNVAESFAYLCNKFPLEPKRSVWMCFMAKKQLEKTLGSYRIENSEVEARIVRFDKLINNGIPLMFIDSSLPNHQRMNYAVIGDTASENSDFEAAVVAPHKFQIGMLCCPPNSGPAYHSHDYCEMFFVMSGRWRFYWGNDPEGAPEGEAILEPWDSISLPMHLWRGFENISDTPAWCFAVLDPHDQFRSKDPYWSERVVQEAAKLGFKADSTGRMIKPEDYTARKAKLGTKLERAVKKSLKARPKAKTLKTRISKKK